MTGEERQRVLDEEHLRLLALFHYISGGVTVVFSLMFGLMFVLMGVVFSLMPPAQAATPGHGQPPLFVLVIFGLFGLLGIAYGVLEIVAGRYIARRRRRVFSIVVSVPRVFALPYGAILTVFTLLVLDRRSVRELYEESRARVSAGA